MRYTPPIPWKSEACRRAGTIHLGGSIDEIAAAERDVLARGKFPSARLCWLRSRVFLTKPRAPHGQHTLWVYCHVPFSCGTDMSDQIESADRAIRARFSRLCSRPPYNRAAVDLAPLNPNLAGGDINGGAANLTQLVARPILTPTPYRTPLPGVYLCSASTPPGGGVHGMCGYHAAHAALRDDFSTRGPFV